MITAAFGNVLLALLALSPLDGLDFVAVPAGRYTVGEKGHRRNPMRAVDLNRFEISTTEVTNKQFARFIESTHYLTDAEKNGFGMTFKEGLDDWVWESTAGATWRCPFGPDQPGIANKGDHPVTQVSFNDALAYCKWAGVRLPSVDEWEVAARGKQNSDCPAVRQTPRWPWGESLVPDGQYLANTWQGQSHHSNTVQDGYLYTAPVGQFPPNSIGLYDVIGNVFEYCTDSRPAHCNAAPLAVGRGGSWWCSPSTCNYFNLIDIGQMDRRATLANQGFRVVRDLD